MTTETIEAPSSPTAPATDAAIFARLEELTAQATHMFPHVRDLHVNLFGNGNRFGISGYVGGVGGQAVDGYGTTFEAATAKLRYDIVQHERRLFEQMSALRKAAT